MALGLAIHELTTNAVKYGALSIPSGELSITWTVENVDGTEKLRLAWDERNGPPVAESARRGFGSMLIERGVSHDLSGTATIEFRPEGVQARLVVPLVTGVRWPVNTPTAS